jgi:hypothetical protein
MLTANRCVVATQAYRPALPNYVWLHYTVPAPSMAIGSALQCDTERFSPTPALIGIPIPRRDAQCPYDLILPHHVFLQPSHLCRLIGVRHVPIPALWSPELSGAPGVTSGLEDILLFEPITAMSAISPAPREPAIPAVLYRGAVAPRHGGWPDNRLRPGARRERTRGNRRRIRVQMIGCPRLSNQYRNGCMPNVLGRRREAVSPGSGDRNPRCGR